MDGFGGLITNKLIKTEGDCRALDFGFVCFASIEGLMALPMLGEIEPSLDTCILFSSFLF